MINRRPRWHGEPGPLRRITSKSFRFDDRFLSRIEFGHSVIDNHFAHQVAEIGAGWGHLEYALYLILDSIDASRAAEWSKEFFGATKWGQKQDSVRRAALKAIADYPEFHAELKKRLSELKVLRELRNPLMHGLWRRLSEREFEVQPLRFDRERAEVVAPIKVDAMFLRDVIHKMDRLTAAFASLSAEMFADQALKRMDSRRKRAAERHAANPKKY